MGLFSNSTPFDNDVDKLTDEKNTSEDWGMIMDFCDRVQATKDGPRDCLKSIIRRLNHQDPHVVIQAITLLDAVVNNCGKPFRLEIASRDFENDYRKLLGNRSHQRVQEKLKGMLRRWAEGDFKGDPQLALIPSLYNQLIKEGIDFSSTSGSSDIKKRSTSAIPKDPNVVSNQQEEDDIAKAIQLSLQESKSSTSQQPHRSSTYTGANATSVNAGNSSLYPSANAPMDLGSFLASTSGSPASGSASNVTKKEEKKARAVYDFEAAEDNELTFKAGEIVIIIDDSDANWWKGSNHRGEGLFPANFVTKDLDEEPTQFKEEKQKQRRRSVTFNEEVEVATLREDVTDPAKQPPVTVEISENQIDQVMSMLNEADPTAPESDPTELQQLEQQVNGMGPLIDAELELVDRRHAQLTRISTELVDALNLYHQLMHEGTMQQAGYGMGMPSQYQAPPVNPAAMYMPQIPPAVASSPQHQPQLYQQNANQQSIPPMQVHTQAGPTPTYPAPAGTAPGYQPSFNPNNQPSNAGNQIPPHMNGIGTEQHQSIMTSGNVSQALNDPGQHSNGNASGLQQPSYYSAAGNAPPSAAGQQGLPPTTNIQPMIQRIPQPQDSHFVNQPIHQQMNHPQQSFIPNGAPASTSHNVYSDGVVPTIQSHGMTQQQALPPLN